MSARASPTTFVVSPLTRLALSGKGNRKIPSTSNVARLCLVEIHRLGRSLQPVSRSQTDRTSKKAAAESRVGSSASEPEPSLRDAEAPSPRTPSECKLSPSGPVQVRDRRLPKPLRAGVSGSFCCRFDRLHLLKWEAGG